MAVTCKYMEQRFFLENSDAQNLENCVEALLQMQPLLDDGYQDVDRDGDPYLRLHGVLRGPEERLDPKMLLDPPEEELHLPPLLVEQGDAFRRKGKIVGQKNQVLFVLDVEEPDPAEFVGVMLRRADPREHDGLIGPHPGRLVDRRGIQPAIAKILLGPDDEEGQAIREGMKPFEIQIPAVHHVIRSGFGKQFVEDVHVVPLPVGDLDERGDVPPQVEQGMEFDGRLPFPEPRPREEGEAQVDCCGVESIHRLFQFHREGIVGIQIPGRPDQDLGEVGVDAPVAVLVGVGQRVPGDPSPDAHVIQLGANGPQARFDVPQALPEGQLREGHAEELVEAGETQDLVVATIPPNALAKFVERKKFEQLREDGLAVVHGPSLPDRNGHRILGS